MTANMYEWAKIGLKTRVFFFRLSVFLEVVCNDKYHLFLTSNIGKTYKRCFRDQICAKIEPEDFRPFFQVLGVQFIAHLCSFRHLSWGKQAIACLKHPDLCH